jgi:hypothetical protein
MAVDRLAPRPLSEPHPDRVDPADPRRAALLAGHDAAMASAQPGYTDPDTGLFVLTAAYLAERGSCCDQNCRHCPYV